jgi:hypothetical protein
MERRRCAACDEAFRLRSPVPKQTHCNAAACQRVRRRRWQQAKRQSDADYRENQARAQRAWAQGHAATGVSIGAPTPNTARAIAMRRDSGNAIGGGQRGLQKWTRQRRVRTCLQWDLPDRAGECRGVCKDGRVDCGNDFDIKAIRGIWGRFAKEDVIGAAGLSC